MDRQQIIARLKDNELALRARGVTHAALFGSRARGDARQDSDTDILIDIDPQTVVSVYDYVGLKAYIAGLFDGPAWWTARRSIRASGRPRSPTRSMPSRSASAIARLHQSATVFFSPVASSKGWTTKTFATIRSSFTR